MEVLKKFNELINEHFIEEHSIVFYEKKLDLKPKYLSKLSKKLNMPPPCQVLLQKQVEHSKTLLLNTSKTIKEIAFEMNFQDQYYFSRIFKNKTGLPPSKYRKMHQ